MIGADLATLLAILGMAAATFAVRASGYLVLRRIQPGPFLRAFLSHLPGTLFVAFAAPAVAKAGLAGLGGAVVTLVVMATTRSTTWSLLAGVGAFWAVRSLAF
ncbi:AzlD family protein [Elioraea rosea]|uniref:AzlD family protein n=1 Tax=Elioraea rosea TaxID=2492390 RepID=UPI00118269F1|nr:AzlD domain-containing protein [Elioraea rosea]